MAGYERIALKIPRGARIGSGARPIYGWDEVPAQARNGLCVHRCLTEDAWRIAHVASGLTLGRVPGLKKSQALDRMEMLLKLPVDWHQDERQTLETLRNFPKIYTMVQLVVLHGVFE